MKKPRTKPELLAVVRENGQFVIHRLGRPIRVRLTNGQRIPVQFETRRAAECYVAVYQFLGDNPEK